jgi:GNAT superfamily N-acetyltransferase
MPARVGAKPPPPTIDHLGAGDGERLRAIRLRALRDAPDAFSTTLEEATARPPESWERQLEQLATFVATASGRDVGLVRGTPHDRFRDAGCLISMWVAPEARRQGIGSALVDAVVHWARARGLNRVLLEVVASNTPAIALYARKGFVPSVEVDTLPPPPSHDREIQLVMRL